VEKIVLGCTHYPFFTDVINKLTQKPDLLIDPADYLVKSVFEELKNSNLVNKNGNGSRKYYVSANPDKFVWVGNKFYVDCTHAERVDLSLIKT
jgi:glutamate racemase